MEDELDRARRLAKTFELSHEDVQRCSKAFIGELRLGLKQRTPSMCQIPTFVTRVAGGQEKGVALGVDLGGTNLRVCSVALHGDTTSTVLQWQLPVPPSIMVCDKAEPLFAFIANGVHDFLKTYHQSHLDATTHDANIPYISLGFTFSFPAYQTALKSGVLLRWTKGFSIPEALGQDVCALLQDRLDALQLPVKVTALVNDAVGTIMARAYQLPPLHIRPTVGAIFGTGTNGAYLQALDEVTKPIEGHVKGSSQSMFMSTEWGSFDNKLTVLPVTIYDAELDKSSVNPGDQMFEKRVSGMFLGELLRLAVLDLCQNDTGQGFNGFPIMETTLTKRWSADSSILSLAEADNSIGLLELRHRISHTFEIPEEHVTPTDAQAVKLIAQGIGIRAARLAGMAVGSVIVQGGLLDKGDSRVDVAVDGSLIEHYPGFETHMRGALKAIDKISDVGERHISIGHTKHGSSVGAAVIALMASGGSQI
ncbi:hypothetical protein PG996_005106 [Apiospora saccharicola]|uniref:Phosphotransferase n=1 Tax=Apiospora saccharicola TaxID=335842 RepID=A0ABR1VKJ3_9PEZI